jgi:hypothetical protein
MEFTVSRHFLSWLHDARLSLAFTTYQTNRLFLVGLKEDGSLRAARVLPRRRARHEVGEGRAGGGECLLQGAETDTTSARNESRSR